MKPVLLWPKPQSTILATLDRNPDDFTVVDTGSRYELRRLSELRSDTPILDPFPGHGKHYREFHTHIAASGCRYVISGLQPCRDVLRLGLCDEPQVVADEARRSSGPLSRLRRAVVDTGFTPGTETFWRTAAQGASIGIFILLFGAFLDLARALLPRHWSSQRCSALSPAASHITMFRTGFSPLSRSRSSSSCST
jgi:hypothetical protein